jgi:hypothetical protein
MYDNTFDDYTMDNWEEPDEAGYSEEEARRDLVEKEIRRRIKRDSKRRRRERYRVGALARGASFRCISLNDRMVIYADSITEYYSPSGSIGGCKRE